MASSDKKIQTYYSFNAGEYSPELAGRVDLESFGSSTRYTSNFLTQVSGGLKKFYGTRHITEETLTAGFSKIKLIPFINKYEPMALVFFGMDDGETSEDNIKVGLVYGDNYRLLDVEIPNCVNVDEMRWKQINDRLILVHKTIQPMTIDFYGLGDDGKYDFRSGNVLFTEIPYFPIGSTNDYTGALTSTTLSGTVTFTIDTSPEIGVYFPSFLMNSSTYTRSYVDGWNSYVVSRIYTINTSRVSVYRNRGGTISTLVNNIACNSPYINKQFRSAGSIAYVEMRDTVSQEKVLQAIKTVYPQSYVEGGIVKIMGVNDHQNGDKYYMTINVGSATYTGGGSGTIWGAASYTSDEYTPVATSTETFNAEEQIGRKLKFYFNDDAVISPWWQGRTGITVGTYVYSNGHWYKATSSGTCGNVQPSHTTGIQSDGGVTWKYVHSGSTTGTIVSVPSSSTINVLIDDGQELPNNSGPNNTHVFRNYSWSIWGKDGIHPSDVYMAGNRLGFVCNTKSYGSWNAMSVNDDYFNFSVEEYGEQLDTSAIVHLVGNNESSDINWVLARKDVYMGGYSGEYHLTSSSQGTRTGTYTPTSTYVQNISNMGGKAIVPLKYKELNMFVGLTGQELYTIAYDYTIEDYTPRSLGYLTQHIMERGIHRIEGLNNLDRNIYLLHDTKQLSLFNYAAEQKVMGFSELNLADDVIDFVTTYAREEVAAYVAVKRNTGKITIERFSIEKPNYVLDEMTQGDGTLADFQPVPHFANREVYLRFGEGLTQFVKLSLDENGDVSHDITTGVYVPQSKYFKIGLPMVSEIHTQPAFGMKAEGHQQQSLYVSIRLNLSGSFEYGSSVEFSRYIPCSYWYSNQEWGSEHTLFTGDCMLNIPLGYAENMNQGNGLYPNTTGVGVNIRSDTPEPLNILSIQEIYK